VRADGGQVVASVRHPLGVSDLSSYLLQAQSSGAQVVGRANDPLFGKANIREDGRHMHPMYLLQVKTPMESKGRVGRFQNRGDDSGARSIPAVRSGQLPAGHEEVICR
jgi:hypothetical protein